MHLDHVGITRSSARTFGKHLVLEARSSRHDAFGSLVRLEEGGAFALALFRSDAVLLLSFKLLLLLDVHEGSKHGGVVHQVLARILIETVLESLDKEVKIQFNGIAGHELGVHLVGKVRTEGVAGRILLGNQGGLGRSTLARAQLVTAGHEHGESASGNNQFCFHSVLF